MRHALKSTRNRAGNVAVEFALLLPVMITLFFGLFEITQAILAYMKLVDATQTVADLVTQQQSVSSSDFPSFYTAGQLVMTPFPGGSLGVAITSVTFDSTGTASVAWHEECGGINPIQNAASLAAGTASNPAKPYGFANESVVIVQGNYAYQSWLHYVLPRALTINQLAFSRPRLVGSIPYQGAQTACS